MNLIIGHGISWNRTLYATLRPPWCDVNQRLISIPLLHRTIYARWIACTYTDNRVFIFHLLIYRARAPHNWLRIGVENNRTVRKEEMGSRSRAFASTQRTWIQQGTGEANHPQINRMFHIAWKRLGTKKKRSINCDQSIASSIFLLPFPFSCGIKNSNDSEWSHFGNYFIGK